MAAIREYEKNPVYKRIGRMFHCSPDQIKRIIQQKESILSAWEQRTIKRDAKTLEMKVVRVSMLGKAVYEWIRRMIYYKDIIITDGLIQKMALQFKNVMGLKNFFPHQDWCDKFRRIYKLTETDSKLLPIAYNTGHSVQIRDILKDVLSECSPSDEQKTVRKDNDLEVQHNTASRYQHNGSSKGNMGGITIDVDDDEEMDDMTDNYDDDDDDDDDYDDDDVDNDDYDDDDETYDNTDHKVRANTDMPRERVRNYNADEKSDENKLNITTTAGGKHTGIKSKVSSMKRSSALRKQKMKRGHCNELQNLTKSKAASTINSTTRNKKSNATASMLPSVSTSSSSAPLMKSTVPSSTSMPLNQLPNLTQLVALPGIGGVGPQKVLVATPLSTNNGQRTGGTPLTMTIIPIASISQTGNKDLGQLNLNPSTNISAACRKSANDNNENNHIGDRDPNNLTANKDHNNGYYRNTNRNDYIFSSSNVGMMSTGSPIVNIKSEIKKEPKNDEDDLMDDEEMDEDENMNNNRQNTIDNIGNQENRYGSVKDTDDPIVVVDMKKEYLSDEDNQDEMLHIVNASPAIQMSANNQLNDCGGNDLRGTGQRQQSIPIMPNLVAIGAPSTNDGGIREESNDSLEENLVLSKLQSHIRNQNTKVTCHNNQDINSEIHKNNTNNFIQYIQGMIGCQRSQQQLPILHQKPVEGQSSAMAAHTAPPAFPLTMQLQPHQRNPNDLNTIMNSTSNLTGPPIVPTIPPMPPLTRAPSRAYLNSCRLEYNTMSNGSIPSTPNSNYTRGLEHSKRMRYVNDQHDISMGTIPLQPIRSAAEAREHVKLLEDFALTSQNLRLIALITRADEVLLELIRKGKSSDNEDEDVCIE